MSACISKIYIYIERERKKSRAGLVPGGLTRPLSLGEEERVDEQTYKTCVRPHAEMQISVCKKRCNSLHCSCIARQPDTGAGNDIIAAVEVDALARLDQMPRNAFRGTAEMFAYDALAQAAMVGALGLRPGIPSR